MPEDLDIYRCAWMLVKRHGNDALAAAGRRADELLDDGDIEGQAVWLRILSAVEDLLRPAPAEGEAVH